MCGLLCRLVLRAGGSFKAEMRGPAIAFRVSARKSEIAAALAGSDSGDAAEATSLQFVCS
jgi:hypothetical protein